MSADELLERRLARIVNAEVLFDGEDNTFALVELGNGDRLRLALAGLEYRLGPRQWANCGELVGLTPSAIERAATAGGLRLAR